jgi:hypothetical protein
MPPNLREYDKAEGRIRQSIAMRCGGLPHHTYDGRDQDLATLRAYHNAHGVPPDGFFRRLWWRLRGKS